MPANPSGRQIEPHTLEEWTQLLRDYEMPIFSDTVRSIHHTLSDDKKGAMELAGVILKDPNMTAKLLKMSNSIYYNPTRQKMITVSRAIVVLGCEAIRELALACSFFESILSATHKQRANEEIARAIHAAVQAKAIAIAAKDPSPEEVFIAALLNNIGSISFWCFSGWQGEQIETLIKSGTCSREQAEKQVLNFKLTDLGVSLSKAWNLGGLIDESIHKTKSVQNARVKLVRLGYEIADMLKDGAESEQMKACLEKIAAITKQPKQVIKENIQKNTETAVTIANHLGAHEASRLIPKGDRAAPLPDAAATPTSDKKQLQFQILQDIAVILSGKIDINLLLETVLEGIHRGVGMDRTVFCLLTPDKKSLKEKMSLGWRKTSYSQKIVFHVDTTPINLFTHALGQGPGLWLDPAVDASLYTLHDAEAVGKNACFLMPVSSADKPIGLIYSDRALSRHPLTEGDFNAFKHFVQQANIGLTLYRMQGRKA